MRTETKSKLTRLIRRERLGAISLGVVVVLLGLGLYLASFLEPWTSSEVITAEVIGFHGVRCRACGSTEALVRLADGREGVVENPQPLTFLIGQRILVRQETSSILGRRRLWFVGFAAVPPLQK